MMKRLWVGCIFLFCTAPVQAQEFEYTVMHRHVLRDCRGVLKITSEGVEYRTSRLQDSRTWSFNDIRILKVKSPTEISIVTYEDQKQWAGKDRVFEFTLADRKVTPDLSEFLLLHAKMPMEVAVLPEIPENPAFEIPVKHLRTISGTRGMLRIYRDKVVYQTSKAGDSRYWRIRDIERFSQPGRFRFQIVSYVPRAGGPTEAYDFELTEDLPEGVYDYLWELLHPSSYYPATRPE